MDKKLVKNSLDFLEIHPKPSQEELNEYYEKAYYQDVTSTTYQNVYSEEEMNYINGKINQKAAIVDSYIKGKGKLLDVGCGEGFVMNFFARKGWDVLGFDFSDFGLMRFNSHLSNNFIKGDVYSLLEQEIKSGNKYELIWLGNVLEHVLDPVDLMKQLRGLLADNGLLVITVPNDGSEYQKLLIEKSYVSRNWWVAIPDHISYFDYNGLLNISEHTGYSCYKLIADMPIDFFLLHPGSNYVENPKLGKDAHKARVTFENFISQKPVENINEFYESLAKLGLGRALTIFLKAN